MNKSFVTSPRLFDGLAIAAFVGAVVLGFIIGTEPTALPENVSEAVRVEIHRYMGYEELLTRYLSLPYDLTVNANEKLKALDVGFLPLLFVPLLLLWGLKKDWMKWVVMASCFFLVVISTSTGILYNDKHEVIPAESSAFAEHVQSEGGFVANLYAGFSKIYNSIIKGPLQLTGERNGYTYPALIGLFLLFFWISKNRMSAIGRSKQGFLVFLLTYLFLFLILSAGIIWYGFLAFPLLLLGICWSFHRNRDKNTLPYKILHYGFLFSVILIVLLGFAQRLSYITLSTISIDNQIGKRIYDPSLLKYQTGELTREGVIEGFFPGVTATFNQINQETESLIYKVGGRYNFFIEKNNERIFPDDQLVFFQMAQNAYQDKKQLTDALKKSGFRYILVDLLMPTMDNSPEKTLVKKFEKLYLFLYNNPQIKLLATDRKIRVKKDGVEQVVSGVFGEPQFYGTYAFFEIQ